MVFSKLEKSRPEQYSFKATYNAYNTCRTEHLLEQKQIRNKVSRKQDISRRVPASLPANLPQK